MNKTSQERVSARSSDDNLRMVHFFEKVFQKLPPAAAGILLLLLLGIFFTLVIHSWPSIAAFGLTFLVNEEWNVVTDEFGSLAFVVGTLMSSFLALLIAMPFALAVALYLGEYYRSGWMSAIMQNMVELLAGIPSVVYGLWGLFVLVPIVRNVQLDLGVPPWGVGIFTAALVLATMIIPYAASIAREVITMVPSNLKEAAYSLGATRYEVVRSVVLPYTRSGIMAGILLALGRALGETMAVTMVIGNSNYVPKSIFSPANTMASLIANEFTEATSEVYIAALIEIGLLLFLISFIINVSGRYIIHRLNK